MNLSIIILSQMSIFIMLLTFLSQRHHFLMLLMCLEGIMLTMVMFIPYFMFMNSLTAPSISIILLTFGACEASLGLSLLVKMSRSYGSDMLSSMYIHKC